MRGQNKKIIKVRLFVTRRDERGILVTRLDPAKQPAGLGTGLKEAWLNFSDIVVTIGGENGDGSVTVEMPTYLAERNGLL